MTRGGLCAHRGERRNGLACGGGWGVAPRPSPLHPAADAIIVGMAFDEILAGRIRTVLAAEPDVTEKRMFGGLAFLVAGRMTVCAGSKGALMLRTDPADAGAPYLAAAEPMIMQGRELKGWLELAAQDVAGDDTLAAVVAHGVRFARTLPPK